jgi:hypothetical protein
MKQTGAARDCSDRDFTQEGVAMVTDGALHYWSLLRQSKKQMNKMTHTHKYAQFPLREISEICFV